MMTDVKGEIAKIEKGLEIMGISRSEFIEQLGISWTSWQMWRKGDTIPRLDRWEDTVTLYEKLRTKRRGTS